MHKHIFISDFDGTITKKDFYWIVIDDYIGQEGADFHKSWKAQQKINVPFLNHIFAWHTFDEQEKASLLDKVEVDEFVGPMVAFLAEKNMDFLILSAGLMTYIKELQQSGKLPKCEIISNAGTFRDGHYVIEPNESEWFFSSIYGVDKETVVLHAQKEHQLVCFAGDSEPDFKAAVAADIRFAKSELADLLVRAGYEFYHYETFEDIHKVMAMILSLETE